MLRASSGFPGPEDVTAANAIGYPEKTVAAVRAELLQRKLECPFPFTAHTHTDFFEALLEFFQFDGLWPDKYDRRDSDKATKQARLDADMVRLLCLGAPC